MTTAEIQKIACPECGQEFENTKSGRGHRATHIKKEHPEATARAKGEGEQKEYIEALPPAAQRFHGALERAMPKSALRIRSLTDTFARNTDTLGRNRHAFRSWISLQGPTQDQIAMVEDELFGVEGFAPGHPMGGPDGGLHTPAWGRPAPGQDGHPGGVEQATNVALRVRDGLDLFDRVDDNLVPVREWDRAQQTGRDSWQPLPPPPAPSPIAASFDGARLRRVKQATGKTAGAWQVDLFFIPAQVEEARQRPYYPKVWLCVDPEMGLVTGTVALEP